MHSFICSWPPFSQATMLYYCWSHKEKGSSSWLFVLPLEEQGFYLCKGVLGDALCLRYGRKLGNTPRTCKCGAQFSVDHAMICHIPSHSHIEIRDVIASLLTEGGHNIITESPLQPLSRDTLAAWGLLEQLTRWNIWGMGALWPLQQHNSSYTLLCLFKI